MVTWVMENKKSRQLNVRDSEVDLQIKNSSCRTMNCGLLLCGPNRVNFLLSALCVIQIFVVLILGGMFIKDL